jgi:SAM-dependent methyltransferase
LSRRRPSLQPAESAVRLEQTNGAAPTHWELAAETRWGRYLTEAEQRGLDRAGELAGGPATALEVGCEGGRWSRQLRDRGWSMICTDVDADALAVCARRIPDAHCILADPDDDMLPVADASLRLLVVFEVEPVTRQAWFAGEAARVLEPGGILVCTYYNPFSARGAAYRALVRVGRRQNHGSDYYAGSAYRIFRTRLRAAGLAPVHEEGLCWFPFRRRSDSALIPLVVRAEATTGLRSLPSLSPFVVLAAVRSGE